MGIFERNEETRENSDFKVFKADAAWFIKSGSKVTFPEKKDIILCEEFKATFPDLTELILKARQTYVVIDGINYVLFAWDTLYGQVNGWLNQLETQEAYNSQLIEEHKLLLKNIGGIRESFHDPEDSFTNSQNFMFIGSECFMGIGEYSDYYTMACEEESKNEIEYSNFLAFAYEANGALTLYDPKTKRVFLFSHDHSFEDVEFMQNQPEYTFHTFKDAENFCEYVEVLARQWLGLIK